MTRLLCLSALGLIACSNGQNGPPPPPAVDTGHKPAAHKPANTVGGFGIQLPALTLQPGDEKFPCFIFPLQITGPSHIVGGGKLTTTPGLHHGNITSRPHDASQPNTARECDADTLATAQQGGEGLDIAAGGAVLFASSTQITGEEWQSFPDGMGFPVAANGFEIVARMHYLNTTAAPLTLSPSYEWYTVDTAKVTTLLGPFAWVLKGWTIPPLSQYTAEVECSPPGPMSIVNAMPHMHALGTGLFAEHVGGPLDGARFLDSNGYDPNKGVITQYDPPAVLGQGEGVRWGCSWNNIYDQPIVWGTGKNEMCILFGYAFPYEQAYSSTASDRSSCVMVAPPPPPM